MGSGALGMVQSMPLRSTSTLPESGLFRSITDRTVDDWSNRGLPLILSAIIISIKSLNQKEGQISPV